MKAHKKQGVCYVIPVLLKTRSKVFFQELREVVTWFNKSQEDGDYFFRWNNTDSIKF